MTDFQPDRDGAPQVPEPDDPAAKTVEVTLAQERLAVGAEWSVSGRVRLHRRVTTEARTVQVTVRREELIVEQVDVPTADGSVVDTSRAGSSAGVASAVAPSADPAPIVIVLHEEVPEVVVRTRAYEQVTARTERITENIAVADTVRREQLAVDEQPAAE